MSGNENDKKVGWTQEAKASIMAANVSYPPLPSRKAIRLQDA